MAASFEPTQWIWRNGEMVRWEDATIHVLSHVVHYGSSVFEGIRAYKTTDGTAIFRLREHMRRFCDSAKIYRMDLSFTSDQIGDACEAVVRSNSMEECYIRPVAFRGYGSPGVNPLTCPVDVYVICWYWGAYLGEEGMTRGIDACVSSWHRMAPNTFPSFAKAGGNYLGAQLMKMEALSNGYDEAIALGPGGMLSEGSGQNLFLVRDGKLFTAALDGTFLPGITRDAVITLAKDAGIQVVEAPMAREMIYIADEAFFTGTAAEITPIRSVDHINVGDGKVGEITRTLQDRLLGIARGKYADTYGWLSPVKMEAGVR
ncbi:MAG TPA: branched-chain amino acid transaminase [Longimicrobiales bacterium]|nr:branched-chain amino acid transaminase [Longimicrobiales bacterium]